MANEQNLKHFKKGQSGNPAGRKKGSKNFKTLLKEILDKKVDITDPVTKKKYKGTADEAIVIALVGKAIQGDTRAFTAIRDTVEGRPNQRVELANPEGEVFKNEVSGSVTVDDDIDYSQLSDEALREIQKLKHAGKAKDQTKAAGAKDQEGTETGKEGA